MLFNVCLLALISAAALLLIVDAVFDSIRISL